jgi:hypothetical protein
MLHCSKSGRGGLWAGRHGKRSETAQRPAAWNTREPGQPPYSYTSASGSVDSSS